MAFELEAAGGMAELEPYASWPEREWPGAAASLREGLEEQFMINRLGLTSALRRSLGTTNLIDNGHSAARDRMRRVKHWPSGEMALRWTAAAFEATSKGFRRIMGDKDTWILKAVLDERDRDRQRARQAAAESGRITSLCRRHSQRPAGHHPILKSGHRCGSNAVAKPLPICYQASLLRK